MMMVMHTLMHTVQCSMQAAAVGASNITIATGVQINSKATEPFVVSFVRVTREVEACCSSFVCCFCASVPLRIMV